MNGVNPIRHWCVRVPGETAWRDEIPSEREALAERELANRTRRPGHEVFARHSNGNWTGPYTGRLLDLED